MTRLIKALPDLCWFKECNNAATRVVCYLGKESFPICERHADEFVTQHKAAGMSCTVKQVWPEVKQ